MGNNLLTGLVLGLIIALVVFIWRKRLEAFAAKEYHAGLNAIEIGLKQKSSRAADFVRAKLAEIRGKL